MTCAVTTLSQRRNWLPNTATTRNRTGMSAASRIGESTHRVCSIALRSITCSPGTASRLRNCFRRRCEALDWCLDENKAGRRFEKPDAGTLLAPLNDLSHDARAWAFNQAYLVAGVDLLGRGLAAVQHPRAAECRAAAQTLRTAIEGEFARASVRSAAVQLGDGTWIPYVPNDAQGSGRLFDVWCPTDVDSGPLHLPRLKAPGSCGARLRRRCSTTTRKTFSSASGARSTSRSTICRERSTSCATNRRPPSAHSTARWPARSATRSSNRSSIAGAGANTAIRWFQ